MTNTIEPSAPRERLWNANYNKVMFTNFTLFFAFYLITPLLPLYLSETYGATKDTIGIVLSGYTLLALISRLFSGWMVDTFPRKTVLMVCLLLYSIFFGSYLLAGSLLSFMLFRTLHGAPFGASTVANSTMAIDVLPASRRGEGIGFYGISNNLGSALGPTAGLWIYGTTHDFRTLFWIAFIISLLGLASSTAINVNHQPRTRRQIEEANAKKYKTETTDARQRPWLDRFFLTRGWYLALNILTFGYCWGMLSNYLAIYGKEHLAGSSNTGLWFMILSLGLMSSRFVGRKAIREGRLLHCAMEGISLSTAGYVIFIALPSEVGYYASAVLIGFGNGHLWPAFQNMIINIASPYERGTANSTILTSWDLGMGAGVLTGGIVAEYINFDAAFMVMAAVHIVGFLIFRLVTKPQFCRTMTNKTT